MRCEDRGPDLLAHALGQLDAEPQALVDSHLAGCAVCRAEVESLRATHDVVTASKEPLAAPAGGLARLLATLGPEIESRHSAANQTAATSQPAAAASCTAFSEDVIALALHSLSDARRDEVEAHVATCSTCLEELETTRLLVSASRAAASLAPAPESLERILARTGEPAQTGDEPTLPELPEPRRSGRPKLQILTWLAPLAIAAGLLVAISLNETDKPAAQHLSGIGYLYEAGRTGTAQVHIGEKSDRFDFDVGDEIHAGQEAFSLEVVCQDAASSDSAAEGGRSQPPGVARLTLAPGSRLLRAASSRFTLRAGQVRVSTGPMAPGFTVDAGPLYATAKGTEFVVTAADARLVVVVEQGTVEIGRSGADAKSRDIHAGEQGLVDAERLLHRPSDGTARGDAFLAPATSLSGPARLLAGAEGVFTAELGVGSAGPVEIAAFDASLPLFLVRLKGPDGRELPPIKLQPSMLRGDTQRVAEEGRTVRLTAEQPYELLFALSASDLEPGRWEARLRYMSYRAQSDGAEWLGVVESEPLVFEVEGE